MLAERVKLSGFVVMSAATLVMVVAAWKTGGIDGADKVQLYAFAGAALGVAILFAGRALEALSTGLIDDQRTEDGELVRRTDAPGRFWMFLAILVIMALAFAWAAAHIAGYAFGLWGWNIGF